MQTEPLWITSIAQQATTMEMATTAAKYVAATVAKYASDPALRHIGFEGWCYACHHLGKELEKKLDELLAQGRIFSSVSNLAPVPSSVGEHFDVFASREATKKKVI
ncbi:hypothetical protein GIB67_029861 [Kingdonia uniflora]|uniref:Uncharacterized protein n=1 Tax=Kingdonia uniflora TaxID=39325 RepID=A0A7J7NJE5_9MAGN|nr:hypothetical protein GIB67_029861 [Kingdonia uniflora]